jgi:hypothetical protein
MLYIYKNDVVPHNSVCPASGMTTWGRYSMVSEPGFNAETRWAG